MYAITGITGRVGGAAARRLLDAGLPVRAVLRDPRKAAAWAERGCELAYADIDDAAALAAAFAGAEAVFLMVPPAFDPAPDFIEARHSAQVLREALAAARPGRVVYLSTIGAQAAQSNLLTQHTLREQALRGLDLPITYLRPGWFMENCEFDLADVRAGELQSYLQPLDRPVPMVATGDIGELAARLLQERWQGQRVVELEGPRRVSPLDIAATFARLLGHAVAAKAVPRDTWEAVFRGQGMRNPRPRAQMLDGFNEGWIAFEGEPLRGATELDTVLRGLLGA